MARTYNGHMVLQNWNRPSPYVNRLEVYFSRLVVVEGGECRPLSAAYPQGGVFKFATGRTLLRVEVLPLMSVPTDPKAALQLHGQTRMAVTLDHKPRATTARLDGRVQGVNRTEFEKAMAGALRVIGVREEDLSATITALREQIAQVR